MSANLKDWRISSHSSEVVIVKPLNHLLYLGYVGEITALVTSAIARYSPCSLRVMIFYPPSLDREGVSALGMTAFCGRSDVDVLGVAASCKLVIGDPVGRACVIIVSLLPRLSSVIYKNTATSDAFLRSAVDENTCRGPLAFMRLLSQREIAAIYLFRYRGKETPSE